MAIPAVNPGSNPTIIPLVLLFFELTGFDVFR
jgi:hypothetical protein